MILQKTLFTLTLLAITTSGFAQKPRLQIKGNYLLKTAWGGSAPLNQFAPNGMTLGCHSTAFAQALFYYRLAPQGKVSYRCSNGISISEDFTGYAPTWDKFALDKESAKLQDETAIERTAQYMYYVATIVRKDFGTDQYVAYSNDFHKQAIESHFPCKLTGYGKAIKSTLAETLAAKPNFYDLLKKEIDAKRPVGFYYTDRKGGGHAVLIDGYTTQKHQTYFHVNFGWLGSSNGWYLLEEDLPSNTKEIALITIIPLQR